MTEKSSGYHDSQTPREIKDWWRTPPAIFAALNHEFHFAADVAASDENHLLPLYFTEAQNSLSLNWAQEVKSPIAMVWCNPPYSNPLPWVQKAQREARRGIGTVMLVPSDTSVGWFIEAMRSCAEIRFIIGGRLSFIRHDTGKPGTGNNKGSMLLIWRPMHRSGYETTYVERDFLMTVGGKVMALNP